MKQAISIGYHPMTFEEAASELRIAFPNAGALLDSIASARRAAGKAALSPFFEPISVFDLSNERSRLLSFGPEMLHAWIRHVSHATHVRLHSLEAATLSELSARRLLPAMVLIRSHLEASAFACLAEQSLMESATTGDPEKLKVLIPKMLFGTSLRRQAKDNELIDSLLSMSEQATITVKEAIGAMEKFVEHASGEPSQGGCRYAYSLLCEFTHSNPRGVRGFSRVLEESDEGWQIAYSRIEEFTEQNLLMALDILLRSVRVGYAVSEILRILEFETSENGFSPAPVPEAEMRRIWADILQGDTSSEDS